MFIGQPCGMLLTQGFRVAEGALMAIVVAVVLSVLIVGLTAWGIINNR